MTVRFQRQNAVIDIATTSFTFAWLLYLAFNAIMTAIGRPGYDTNQLISFGVAELMAAFVVLIFAAMSIKGFVFRFLAKGQVNEKLSFWNHFAVSDSEDYRLFAFLGNRFGAWIRFLPSIIYAGIIGIAVIGSNGFIQAWPINQPFLPTNLAITVGEKVMFQAVHPGWLEDFVFGIIIPNILMFIGSLILAPFGINVRQGNVKGIIQFTILAFVCCSISSLGYGAVITGFASTHQAVQGSNIAFYLSAWIFGTINAMIYQLTGLFWIPLAHLTNNLIFSLSLSIGFAFVMTKASAIIASYSKNQQKGDLNV